MKEKSKILFLLAVIMFLPICLQAAVITFQTTEPTPGPLDVFNLVGVTQDRNNVGTATSDGAFNDSTTYAAMDRGAQGQTFVTRSGRPVYLITGIWIRHCGYTEENTVSTWWGFTSGGQIGIRVTNPSASGAAGFVLSSETYTITSEVVDLLGGPAQNDPLGTGTWFHIVLDNPVALAANTEYGFDITCLAGSTNFFELWGIKDSAPDGNPYPDGTAYTSGLNGAAGGTLRTAPGDRVFVVELTDAPPATASIPNPADKAIAVPQDVALSWVPGFNAVQHDVYFGESYENVDNATTSTSDIYKGRQDANSFSLDALSPDTTYYWRIDEVRADGTTIDTGRLWSFTTEPSKAWNPAPYNSEVSVFIDPDPNLSWNSGYNSTASEVYFGTNPDSLVSRTTITHAEGLERYSFDVTGLVNNQDYYWRVDQVQADASVIEGDLWYFTTIPVIPVADPNLVGWWKFDEGPGKAIDWSGLNQHGNVIGDPVSVAGYDGGAMFFDAVDDYVDLPIGSTIASLESTTITTWVNFSSAVPWQRIFDFGNDPGIEPPAVYMYLTPLNAEGMLSFVITNDGTGGTVNATETLPIGWHHVAVTIDAATNNIVLYLDGTVVGSDTTEALPSDLGDTDGNWLGRSKFWDPPDPYFTGSLDDFRIYDYALTSDEIVSVMQIDPLRAREPSPVSGSTPDILNATPLSWTPGTQAVQSDVYFGTDEKAVADADTSTADIYRGRQSTNSYTPPEDINYNQTYYWRIDGVGADAAVGKGHVWSFTVVDYLLLDDFESYNDLNPDQEGSNRIFLTWVDGYENPTVNGSTMGYPDPIFADGEHFVEVDVVHGGSQSAPLLYNNSVAGYSEVTVNTSDLVIGRNWAQYDVQVISLWFYGNPDNAVTEQLYVKLNDSKITYQGSPAKLATPQWTQWNINLSDFGISLSNVTQIGVGLERTGVAGGSGTIFLDDIRLYW
ncbi:MAG: LamG domain-containing protein [Sedimentisphaerales bacterium]|nr:LamG domain-containing protein [Sedimentisphaerales bacterium]